MGLLDRLKDEGGGKDALKEGAKVGGRLLDALDRLASPEGQAKLERIAVFVLKMLATFAPLFAEGEKPVK